MTKAEDRTRVVIMGAAGRDFHDFNTLYREDPMAPGAAHPPMYDENIEYPWHQYETTTRAISR